MMIIIPESPLAPRTAHLGDALYPLRQHLVLDLRERALRSLRAENETALPEANKKQGPSAPSAAPKGKRARENDIHHSPWTQIGEDQARS